VRRGLFPVGLCVGEDELESDIPVRRVRTMQLEHRARALGLTRVGRSRPVLRELRGLYRLGRHAWITARLVGAAGDLERCAIVHANDFDTLPACALLARRWGARLVYDSHELYTMQEPDPPRLYRAVVLRLERWLARRSAAVITVSEAYAAELVRSLRLRRPPYIVMNCPPVVEAAAEGDRAGPVRAIYQAAMGPGRRVEDVVEAAAHADGALVTLRVLGADRAKLGRLVDSLGLDGRVEVAEPVPADSLVQSLAGFDVGLIINRPVTRNDELVLPNKLFEYMMAGLAVVSPDLPVSGAFVRDRRIGMTFPPGDTAAMGRAIGSLAGDAELLRGCKARARALAVETYNAEAQAAALASAWGLEDRAVAVNGGSAP
jgi:glycosyltransferase involved in cell wall biosynthesis